MDDETQTQANSRGSQPISWTASEFVHSQRDIVWFGAFFGALIAICVGIYIFVKDIIASVSILTAGILFLIMVVKKPRAMQYSITDNGISIGEKFYDFSSFKSFNLSANNGISSVDLIPIKRFGAEISIFLPPEQGQTIVNLLSTHLPHDERVGNKLDALAKKLRF